MTTTPTQTKLLQQICEFQYSIIQFNKLYIKFLNPKKDIIIYLNIGSQNVVAFRQIKLNDGTYTEMPCAIPFKLLNLLSEFVLTLEEN